MAIDADLLDDLNRRGHADLAIASHSERALRLWLGDCCACCSKAVFVCFRNPTLVRGLDDDLVLDDPWFRLASPAEVVEHRLEVPAGSEAYCIAPAHGRAARVVFVVAQGVALERG